MQRGRRGKASWNANDFFKIMYLVHKLFATLIFIKIHVNLKTISFVHLVYNYTGLLTIEFPLKSDMLSRELILAYVLLVLCHICDSIDTNLWSSCVTSNKIKIYFLFYSFLHVVELPQPICPQCTLSLPLKTSENYKVFWCFQWVEKVCIGNKWTKYV